MFKAKVYLLFIVLFILPFGTYAQSENINFTNGAKIEKMTYSKTDKDANYEADVEYPQLVGVNSDNAKMFNKLVKEKAFGIFNEFVEGVKEDGDANGNTSEISYAITLANDSVISIVFGNFYYTGGVHPNSASYSFNFDLKNGKEITLKDLFRPVSPYLEIISDEAISRLEKHLNSPNDEWIRKGASAKEVNFSSWNLTPVGLQINFQTYQVGPYVIGPQEVIIPYREMRRTYSLDIEFEPIKSAIKPDISPSYYCGGDGIETYKLAKVKSKSYFYGVKGDYDYPFMETDNAKKYQKKSYVVSGDEILVIKVEDDWACTWYQANKGIGTVGWIQLGNLSIIKKDASRLPKEWLGNWSVSDYATLTITDSDKKGFVNIEGSSTSMSYGGAIHIGVIESVDVKPKVSRILITEDDCRLSLRLIGKYLLADDNDKCGGAGVTFSGVYKKGQ